MKKMHFLEAINTLKLYRRAELADEEGQRLVKELYVDPLPDNHVLNTILRSNTTFLIGRKGTGKSTIFQRAQEELDSNAKTTWAYIDIKSLYESSTSEVLGAVPETLEMALDHAVVRRLAIFKNFVIELVSEIRKQVEARIDSNLLTRLKSVMTGTKVELFDDLDEFISLLKSDQFINVTGVVQKTKNDEHIDKDKEKVALEVSPKLSPTPSIEAKLIAEIVKELETKKTQNYSEVYIRVFNIRGLINKLREILSKLKIRHLYIFVDDFSELPKNEMQEVVDTILAPFNNWSDEFIKLKVAVYPGRVYFGTIDRSKVDEVYLDIYRAYGRSDVSGMEEKAIDFTKRLVEKRFEYYCKDEIQKYMEVEASDFWRHLFYASIGNPRILGYILFFAYETNIVYDKKIGIRTIQDASRRYYEEKIYDYFRMNKFLHETFSERSSIFSLKELLEEIVKRAKVLRHYRDSKMMSEIEGRPPTSHFHVLSSFDSVLSSLELNFFITKYYEMRDRDSRDVSVYALNYGLCQQQAITFGRPRGKREYRLYFVERIFDYSPILSSYLKVNQEIVCDSCNHRHDYEMLAAIQTFDMLCPVCKKGTCKIVNLSKKYEKLIRDVSAELLLPETELGILKTLHDERRKMFAREIASELDCSYQLVGWRGKNLADRDLVAREKEGGRRVYVLKDTAKSVYFSDVHGDEMDFE